MFKKKRINFVAIITVIALIISVASLVTVYMIKKPVSKVVLEVGTPVPQSDTFLKDGDLGSSYKTDIKKININEVKENEIKIKSGFFTYKVKLIYKDTVAPVVTAKKRVSVAPGESPKPEDFIKKIDDFTECRVSLDTKVASKAYGAYDVSLTVTDMGGNETRVKSKLCIVDPNVICDLELKTGSKLKEKMFFKDFTEVENKEYEFSPDLEDIDMTTAGEKEVFLKVDGDTFAITIMVGDTDN